MFKFLKKMAQRFGEASRKMVYSLVPKSRYEEIATLMTNNFYKHETISKTLGLFDNGPMPSEVKELHLYRLEQGISHFAVDEQSKETVGVLTVAPSSQNEKDLAFAIVKEMRPRNPTAWDGVLVYVKTGLGGFNSLEELTGCQKICRLHDLFIDSQHRKFGIGQELTRRSTEMSKDGDFEMIATTFTAKASIRILKNLNFQILSKTYYKDVMLNGKPLFGNLDGYFGAMGLRLHKN